MSRAWWRRWTRRGDALTPGVDPGVSFAWPRDTDLTREQLEIAMRDEVAAPSTQPDAGRTVETTAQHAPRPNEWREGSTPVLGGVTGKVATEPGGTFTLVSSIEPNVWGEGVQGPAALLDYADSLVELRAIEYGDALDSKQQIRAQLAACRSGSSVVRGGTRQECGDGPPTWDEWAR